MKGKRIFIVMNHKITNRKVNFLYCVCRGKKESIYHGMVCVKRGRTKNNYFIGLLVIHHITL